MDLSMEASCQTKPLILQYMVPITRDLLARVCQGLPGSEQAWLGRAKEVSEILATNAAARDIENKSPRAEISLLKSAGFLKVLP